MLRRRDYQCGYRAGGFATAHYYRRKAQAGINSSSLNLPRLFSAASKPELWQPQQG
jgi:hypothetical protein